MSNQPPPGMPSDWPASAQSRWAVPLSRALMTLLCRYRVEGRENIPTDQPVIFAANHLSYFDVPAVDMVCPPGVVGLAARKYKGTPVERLFELYAVLWVTQFSADREALKSALRILNSGVSMAIAPEGTRSRTGGLIEGRSGIAFLATRANVPIVPAAVWGTEKILKHPRPRVKVRFGKPFRLPEGRAKGAQLDEYTERIMCALAALLPEQYHGCYAGNPLIDEMRAIVT
ncbi:MAG: 1-acyl-sn-glycerol-3-phosphate acyltransferase [Anaerolineae bacterium]|nr:1-acyl-sn-glycerol-3-phosphate acyltransferase [Anaerolineae bacterium]